MLSLLDDNMLVWFEIRLFLKDCQEKFGGLESLNEKFLWRNCLQIHLHNSQKKQVVVKLFIIKQHLWTCEFLFQAKWVVCIGVRCQQLGVIVGWINLHSILSFLTSKLNVKPLNYCSVPITAIEFSKAQPTAQSRVFYTTAQCTSYCWETYILEYIAIYSLIFAPLDKIDWNKVTINCNISEHLRLISEWISV